MGTKKRILELIELIEAYLGEDGGVPVCLPEEWNELKQFILYELIK